jgi:nitrate reductase gamma subunit
MENVTHFVRGPLLLFAFMVLFLGLLRQLVITAVELWRAYEKAGDQRVPVSFLFKRSLGWIFPVNAMRGTRTFYTFASLLFHAGMLLVPLFLAGHVELVRRGIGLSWPTLPPGVADGLTLAALVGLASLAFLRLADRASRTLGTFQDWFLLALCSTAFLSGYFVAHPSTNPLPFTVMYLVHLLSAELILLLLPFTKLAHAALFPFTRISWELGWHFVPGSGERVREALGKAGEPV